MNAMLDPAEAAVPPHVAQARQHSLARYNLTGLRDTGALQQITDFVAALCAVPIALVTLMDGEDQLFLARTGTDIEQARRDTSFCIHAMRGEGPMVVPDARADARFADNAFVTGDAGLRFYAGVPLTSEDGVALGTLCVFDTKARHGLTPLQQQGLVTLADNVMARLQISRDTAAHHAAAADARESITASEARFAVLADTMPQMVWSTLPDGFHDYYNARWYEFTGAPAGTTDGEGWNDMFHPDDQERAWSVWRASLDSGAPYQIEYRLRHHDGTYRWVLGRALPMRDATGAITRWFGTCTDIHEQKLALEEREVISQELSHRIKNIFAVISGLIQFAARSNPGFGTIATDLRHRITALGRAHDFVRPHSAQSRPLARQDSLHGLLLELFEAYQQGGAPRIAVTGDEVAVDDRAATPIALLFHEVATNATKYGALSDPAGRVTLSIAHDADSVVMVWTEHGGPIVAAPPHESAGFGSQLIELSAVRQLGGSVARDWRPEGLALTVAVPLAAFSRPGAAS